MRSIALTLALLLSSPAVLADQVEQSEENAAAKCGKPSAPNAQAEPVASPETAGATSVKSAQPRSGTPVGRSGARWHSLLPGMFR